MSRVYNRPEQVAIRRRLRREMAPAEVLLCLRLRNQPVGGLRFRRQYGIGPYVLDFYCAAVKLAIEIDGETHITAEAAERDAVRQRYVEQFGVRFLRFSDREVCRNPDGVAEYVLQVASSLAAGQSFPEVEAE